MVGWLVGWLDPLCSVLPVASNQTTNSSIRMADTAVEPVIVITSDAKPVIMSRPAAAMSKTIDNLVSELGVENPVPVPSVTEAVMMLVKEYAEYKVANLDAPAPEDDAKKDERRTDNILPWDKAFMDKLEQSQLFDLIMAANYLEFKSLLDLGCKTVANMIKGKSVEELRVTFHLKNEFTPDEEKKVREENEWCDERQ